MGQSQFSGTYFKEARVRKDFKEVENLWTEEELFSRVERIKELTLNFSLDRVKFGKLLQLPANQEDLVENWFQEFSKDRATKVVDGLEFLSAVILLSKVDLVRKTVLLFALFDLEGKKSIRKDEFTIFLKAISTGLHRSIEGLPPPSPVAELSSLSSEYFSSLGKQALTQEELLIWVTEAHASLNYLSVLSHLQSMVFAWGVNERRQLGLFHEPARQTVPAPVLKFQGMKVNSVASSESHSLFLTSAGTVWTCGQGFCGILGHGNLQDCSQPRVVESLTHARIINVAAGVRHSVAVSEKGQVFTWGSADMGQLGHGPVEDSEVHEVVHDPRSGGTFAYIPTPTVVMSLFGQRVQARHACCSNFSTAVLTNQSQIYTWGNNTDGQCGQGADCPDQKLIFLDQHLERTAIHILETPRLLEVKSGMQHPAINKAGWKSFSCGGYHSLAIDADDRLWTWGQGRWGKLGHGSMETVYEPCPVDMMRNQRCQAVAAGEAHSMCLIALHKLKINDAPFHSPGLSLGSRLQEAVSTPMLEVKFPAYGDMSAWLKSEQKPEEIQQSTVIFDRGLVPGTYISLADSKGDFTVHISADGGPIGWSGGIDGELMFLEHEEPSNCQKKICIFDSPNAPEGTSLEAAESWERKYGTLVMEMASRISKQNAAACIFALPEGVATFSWKAPSEEIALQMKAIPFGVISHKMYTELRKLSPKNAPATLVDIREDTFEKRLEAVLERKPKAIVICQHFCRQLEFLRLDTREVPVTMISFEAGQELRSAIKPRCHLSVEVHTACGLCGWGDSTRGQLGLGSLQNQEPLVTGKRPSTGEDRTFVERPRYIAQMHMQEVAEVACGRFHTAALAKDGQVFTWGASEVLGCPMGSQAELDEPLLVEQLRSNVQCKTVFAGHRSCFVVAALPFECILQK